MKNRIKHPKHIRIIPKPFNYSFTLMFEEYDKEFVEILRAPGIFVKKANTQVKLPDGRTGEMDAPYIADPDYITLFERAIVILEHQRIAIGIPKSFRISNYAIPGVSDEKLPFYIAVASHIDSNKHQMEFERTDSFIIRLKFLDLGKRDNWEKLNSVRNKLRFNKNLSVKDALNLGTVVLFAPDDCARERTREALHYYLESEITSKRLKHVLYSVFFCMIDEYFDDELEYQRMIEMLNDKTSLETKEKFASEIRRENMLKQVSAERDKAIMKNNEITAERDEAYEFIKLLLPAFEGNPDEKIKKEIIHFKKILKNSNVWPPYITQIFPTVQKQYP